MEVRPATVADAPEIEALRVRAWQVAYAGVIPGGYLMAMNVDAGLAKRCRLITEAVPPSAFFVVSDDDQAVCGFAHVSPYRADVPESGVGEMPAIYVHPSHWSTGAGLALMHASVGHLADAGFAEIRLWVLEANPRARRFYERFGFATDGATRTMTVDPDGAFETRLGLVRYSLAVR